jgi:hypothetical protein
MYKLKNFIFATGFTTIVAKNRAQWMMDVVIVVLIDRISSAKDAEGSIN